MNSLSWKLYDNEHGLSEILTDAARACVEEGTKEPKSFLASYFLSITTGDAPKTITFQRYLTPSGECGLTVRIVLYTNVDTVVRAWPVIADANGNEQATTAKDDKTMVFVLNTEKLENLESFLKSSLTTKFVAQGVYNQKGWDATLQAMRGEYPDLTAPFCFSFSIAATAVAARNMDIALYEHVRRLSRQSDSGTRKEEERFALPRVLIPLMGSHGAEIPSGLLLETVYLIPTPPDTEGGKGALTAETWQRLHALVRYCSQQCDSRMRPDGSLLMPHMDNLTDVLELIKAAAEKVGMTLGEDVRVGIRFNCAAQSVQLSQTTAPAKGKKAAAKEVPSAENVEPTWVYTLFAGEAEVTGAQLSEYVIQQLTSFPNHGVIFLEDSHDTTDTEGWYRLHNAFKTMAVLSCRGAFSRHRGSAASLESLLAQVSASHIAANIALDPIQITDVSHFLSLAGASQKQNLWMSVYRGAEEGGAQEHLVDLAVGTGSSFVDIGPLLSASALVSRLLCVQERLSAQRQMEEQVHYVGRNSEEDFPVSAAEVPEIKRKNEKKKKKK